MAYGHPANRPIDLFGQGRDSWAEIRREVYGIDARQHGWSTRDELGAIAGWLQLEHDSRLLDIGCGEGGPAQFLSWVSGAEVVGVDGDPEFIELGTARIAATRNASQVRLITADATERLPFESEAFDAVNCVDVIPHL